MDKKNHKKVQVKFTVKGWGLKVQEKNRKNCSQPNKNVHDKDIKEKGALKVREKKSKPKRFPQEKVP